MRTVILLFLSVLLNLPLWAQAEQRTASSKELAPVVIVSSYNTAVRHVNENLAEFFEEYTRSGIPNPITVEDINAHNLRDCLGWRHRLRRVLRKYYEHGNRPACIVLLGLEASSVFFSFDDAELKRTPVVVGMRNSAIVRFQLSRISTLWSGILSRTTLRKTSTTITSWAASSTTTT